MEGQTVARFGVHELRTGLAVDVSDATATLTAAGACDMNQAVVKLDSTAGAMAVTIAAPGANDLGKVVTVEMVVDGGDVTITLTNVIGGTAATTATFANINEALVLLGGTNKWHVVAESGVTLA